MEEKNIEQLWWTWSNDGLDCEPTGFRARAASPRLRHLYEADPHSFIWYLRYKLPMDVPQTIPPTNAPVSLSFLKTANGDLLTHKVYVGLEGFDRTGNYFTHLMLLTGSISARMAIELWKSSIWQRHNVPKQEQDPDRLKPLALGDIAQTIAKQHFDFSLVEAVLQKSIIAFLSKNRLQQRMVLQGHPEQIAAVIWGLTHSIPSSLLPDLTFTTYDDDVQNSKATIIGTISAEDLMSPTVTSPTQRFKYAPIPYEQTAPNLDTDIAAFAKFAVTCLQNSASSNSHTSDLEQFMKEAEHDTSVQAFMQRFNQYRERRMHEQPLDESRVETEGLTQLGTSSPKGDVSTGQTKLERTPAPPPNMQLPPPGTHRNTTQRRRYEFTKLPLARLTIAAVILLLLLTNSLTYFITTHNVGNTSTPTTAITPRQTPTPKTPIQSPDGDKVQTLYVSSQPTVKNDTDISLYIVLLNIGPNTWSDQDGYHLVCVDPKDPDCQHANISPLADSIPSGSPCIFTIQIHAQFAVPQTPDQGPHTVDVILAHGNQTFGKDYKLSYKVTQ